MLILNLHSSLRAWEMRSGLVNLQNLPTKDYQRKFTPFLNRYPQKYLTICPQFVNFLFFIFLGMKIMKSYGIYWPLP